MKRILLFLLLSGCGYQGFEVLKNPIYQPLLSENRIQTNSATCISQSGLVVNWGLDKNNNGSLDGNEVTQSDILCDGTAGQNGSNGQDGQNGTNGSNGTNGTNGQDGVSCTVTTVVPSSSYPLGGAQLTCGTQTVVVLNGAAGSNAQALEVVQEITPCGPSSSPWKEVLLQLAGGNLLGSFSDNASGLNTRFSDFPDGSYVDTDNSGCNFTVSTSGSTRSISWAAGSNAYSTWPAETVSWPIY
jgi:hypothetical protein